MILRIFATDGFTPERIFRWSVEETARLLCPQQVLWVTRLDGPYQPLVDWFQKQPCCRGVMLDRADRWEWNLEHEVTFRLAQGLYFQDEPEAVCWLHDDMAPPESHGFKVWLWAWLASRSTAMEAPAYTLWNDPSHKIHPRFGYFGQVRADKVGVDIAGNYHSWLAKWQNELAWLKPGITPDSCFRPLNAREVWQSPYPFRHARGIDKEFREQRSFTRRGATVDHWRADNPRCVPYNPDATWEEFKAVAGT